MGGLEWGERKVRDVVADADAAVIETIFVFVVVGFGDPRGGVARVWYDAIVLQVVAWVGDVGSAAADR